MKNFITLNVLMYILIFGLTVYVSLAEGKEWKCYDPYNVFSKCEKADGMPYRGSKPNPSDDCSTLLKKINIAAGASSKSIIWRRSLVLSVIIAFVAFILVITPGSLPSWTKFYLVTLIGIVFIYYSLNYYDYHKYNTPREYITESTEMIKKKCTAC